MHVFVQEVGDRRRRTRIELLRWHPDKFEAAFGKRLLACDKAEIMARVKQISQILTATWE